MIREFLTLERGRLSHLPTVCLTLALRRVYRAEFSNLLFSVSEGVVHVPVAQIVSLYVGIGVTDCCYWLRTEGSQNEYNR